MLSPRSRRTDGSSPGSWLFMRLPLRALCGRTHVDWSAYTPSSNASRDDADRRLERRGVTHQCVRQVTRRREADTLARRHSCAGVLR